MLGDRGSTSGGGDGAAGRGEEEVQHSYLYFEATPLPKERGRKHRGPWRGRLGVRGPRKISEMEESGEGRASQDKEMAQKRTRKEIMGLGYG